MTQVVRVQLPSRAILPKSQIESKTPSENHFNPTFTECLPESTEVIKSPYFKVFDALDGTLGLSQVISHPGRILDILFKPSKIPFIGSAPKSPESALRLCKDYANTGVMACREFKIARTGKVVPPCDAEVLRVIGQVWIVFRPVCRYPMPGAILK